MRSLSKRVLGLATAIVIALSIVSCDNNTDSLTNCEYQENLSEVATRFIGRCCIAAIRREFPGEFYDSTLDEINQLRSENRRAQTAYKLLNDGRFRK